MEKGTAYQGEVLEDLEQTGRKEAMASVQSANHPRRLNHQGQKTNKQKKPYVPQGPVKVDNDDDDLLSKSQCHLHIHIFLSQQLIPCTL